MKKNYKANKTTNSGMSDIIAAIRSYAGKKGFYIALFALVAILTSSVFITSYIRKSENIGSSFNDEAWKAAIAENEENNLRVSRSELNSADSGLKMPESEIKSPGTDSAETGSSKSLSAAVSDDEESVPALRSAVGNTAETAKTNAENEVTVVSVSAENSKIKLDMPCIGGIIKEYSMDELLYSNTMEDWRTHSGIDIAADTGTQVKAAADGITEQVYTDEILGNVIIINHGNGIKTLYGNLQSSDYIEVKRPVKKGDIIGGIGTSSAEERSDEPHLHFEVLKDDEPVSPDEYF